MSSVKRTYAKRPRIHPASDPTPSSPRSSSPTPSPSPIKRKRSLFEQLTNNTEQDLEPPRKKRIVNSSATGVIKIFSNTKENATQTKKTQPKKKTLTQLHLTLASTTLRTCQLCSLTYTRGAPDDEALHKSHCARVVKGMEWGKDEEKASGVEAVEADVKIKSGQRGRIVSFRCDVGGKLGNKLAVLLETINVSLSAPELTREILAASKAYLFLLPATSGASSRERIVGCVVAQRITTAMAIVKASSYDAGTSDLVQVDGGLYCAPKQLPTPMGVSRVFVPSTHRRKGIALHLLNAAARTFVYGCPLSAERGEIAFSQPTGLGKALMTTWGDGGVRIFEE